MAGKGARHPSTLLLLLLLLLPPPRDLRCDVCDVVTAPDR
jgi:hypothetical protein